ncbi:MAG: GTPase [Chlorobiaceae bacterium]|nr:GTPase [Chlorobiaceae bacterium]
MKLIFVYNADSGPISGLFDIGHKIIRPDTYSCGLCKLTFDTFTEKQAWRAFRESSPVEMEFLHRDEFEKIYSSTFDYPVILRQNGEIEILLSKKEIDGFAHLDDLIEKIKECLKE